MPTKRIGSAWSGWLFFAATLLLIMGVMNVMEGIVALVYPARTVVIQDRLYVVDLAGWGVLLLVFGVVLIAAAIGVLSGSVWARVVAIVLVCLHAVVQVGWLAAYPFWSLLMLGLDVVVLYGLTARWASMTRIPEEPTSPTHNGHTVGVPPSSTTVPTAGQRPRATV